MLKIERNFQTFILKGRYWTLDVALWWPRKLWGRGLSIAPKDHFVFVVGPLNILVY